MNKSNRHEDTKHIFTLIVVNVLYISYLYLFLKIQYKYNLLIQLEAIDWENIVKKIFLDAMAMLLFPSIIIFTNRSFTK
jgi:hypothetical protein